jgi:hypothetical protein
MVNLLAASCSTFPFALQETNAMNGVFGVHIFYPDGGPPESGSQPIDALSVNWLSICRDLLNAQGAVFSHNMGSTLSHFDIELAGPVGRLVAYGKTCFDIAITLGANTDQDVLSSTYFRKKLDDYVNSAGNALSQSALDTIDAAATNRCVLLIDKCVSDVDDEQKHALIQIGYHLVAAYYEYTSQE